MKIFLPNIKKFAFGKSPETFYPTYPFFECRIEGTRIDFFLAYNIFFFVHFMGSKASMASSVLSFQPNSLQLTK